MATFRQIMALIALAFTSAGNLPLVVHQLTCHHPHSALVVPAQTCACSHHCLRVQNAQSQAVVEESHSDDCVVCFQLSQVSQSVTETSLERSCLLTHMIAVTVNPQLSALDCPHSPRGPPAV